MRAVADTNIVISGLFWQGAPRQVLDAARQGKLELFTSAALLAELADVLVRPKFEVRLARARVAVNDLILGYAALAKLVQAVELQPVVVADADDDAVLACALAAHAEVIVSGDSHLLNLKRFREIPIYSAAEILTQLES
jgi:uncharacterized protein